MSRLETILRRLYDELGFTKDLEFCEKYDIKPNTLSTWKKRNKIPYELLEEISQNENISMDYLLTGQNEKKKKALTIDAPKVKTVKSITALDPTQHLQSLQQEAIEQSYIITKLSINASAGTGIENFEVEETEVLLNKELFRQPVNEKNLRMILVKGDSMEPTILDESHIVIDTTQKENIDSIYAINLGGQIMVKRLQFNIDGTIEILSDNIKYAKKIYDPEESQIHFEILGKKILSIQ